MKHAEWLALQQSEDTDRRADAGFSVVVHAPADEGSIPSPATIDKRRSFELAMNATEYFDLDPDDRRQVWDAVEANQAEFIRFAAPGKKTSNRRYEVL